jgi:hypothetical protein
MRTDVADGVAKEFDGCLAFLSEAVQAIPDDEWAKGAETRAMPVHQVCHTVSVILRYAHSEQETSDIRIGWKPQSKYPSRQRLLKIIRCARSEVARYIADAADRTLADRKWSIPPLHKVIYLFRHSVWHLCCLHEELRARGLRPPKYRKTRWRTRKPKSAD